MLGQSLRQNTFGLALFAVITAGLIAITQLETQTRIEENVRLAKSKALNELIPHDQHDNDLLSDRFWVDDPRLVANQGPQEAYYVRRNGEITAVILPAIAPDGYTGTIRSIVGVLADGKLAGVRVLAHQETPGLGDKIEIKKSDWIRQFEGKSLLSPFAEQWAVKKDGGAFDQLTGATITPRAVVKSVHRALVLFQEQGTVWLAPPAEDTNKPGVAEKNQETPHES